MKSLNILLVEDNESDIILVKEALKGVEVVKSIIDLRNGKEAVSYLKKLPPYENATLPDLILLDINMPIMDGLEALAQIKVDEKIKHIPVIILTTSSRKEDIFKAYSEHSNSYIIKPNDYTELEKVAEVIRDYWQNTVKLPKD
ncbi:chemotaxis family two-component system response regulator Rcp1 [Roseivirga ehrenbergii]|uniref:Response regulator receiver protein n=1 Tax=Roseivirga ehrenbergii (strain DSM 102268 / JCM 13514 / KCTC 12282 / NCIMB 14502 / KMM 6017) TaxID=279360 RepID=A0A150X8D9_ROSEK|nr:response regulator [Roseivirga ehrenbergii]KYG75001.1 response regulator receiver protein [Roseivirga ehrenbergii]TCL13647.1 chemotaxis family two-component system response regulator Rcp1 [Roseivirga ehrenbergii]